ncbi:probable serine/threonine-protein kinase At1g01540 [Humulus lupulus]|uniref:probable serine/threonine-protein kinase At1g01540 n=1 Tax=Humulus lupulus TaxID=3486 RepID=UPI002B40BD58|nr:probable serine/threonine-protein kinase At1g01540 [Humulus lupulus]
MSSKVSSLGVESLFKPTSFFHIKLWILVLLIFSLATVIIIIIYLYLILCGRHKSYKARYRISSPNVGQSAYNNTSSLDRRLLSRNLSECETMGFRYGPAMSGQWSTRTSCVASDVESLVARPRDAGKKMFSMNEIDVATNGFARENVIGNGDYGTVYCGVLFDNTRVAVKKLLTNSCHLEEFIAQVEAIGHVRHKNLVKLLGYCLEGVHRILVYEYVDNNNLQHWLHQCPQQIRLSWSMRMNIIQGIAKGLAYLHEGIEQKILHRSLKSSNIMLDHQFNPKITDFSLANLFGPRWGYSIMESLGYLAPEYDDVSSPITFTEKHDVYSFGILIMEIITGRLPIDHHESHPYLVEWLKSMVAMERTGDVLDPSLPELPCSIELKRILLIALRCVDLDEDHRPNMGDVIHMLQPRDLLLQPTR